MKAAHMSHFSIFSNNIDHFLRKRIPGQVVIQITNRCNALCPQCGMRRTADIPRASLSDDTMKSILHGCAINGVQAVSFTGGEPLLFLKDLLKWINWAGEMDIPFIRTGTNGFMFCGSERPGFHDRMTRLADQLASTPLRNFWISLDAFVPEVHESMRGLPGVVEGIGKALPIFHRAGILPAANLGINRRLGGEKTAGLRPEAFARREAYLAAFLERYKEAFDQFYGFVAELGFTTVNTCYPMSISPQDRTSGLAAVYGATALEDIVRYHNDEKAMLFKALLETIPRHRHHLRVFTPLCSVHSLYRTYAEKAHGARSHECRGGLDFFFIDSRQGDTFPCGYRGNENLGKLWELDVKKLSPGDGCRRCDWECFRDPSELCGPILQAFRSPLKLLGRMLSDPVYRRLWVEDLKYYRRCDFFNGRVRSVLN